MSYLDTTAVSGADQNIRGGSRARNYGTQGVPPWVLAVVAVVVGLVLIKRRKG